LGFCGGVVIHDDMDIEPFGDLSIDFFEEVQEFGSRDQPRPLAASQHLLDRLRQLGDLVRPASSISAAAIAAVRATRAPARRETANLAVSAVGFQGNARRNLIDMARTWERLALHKQGGRASGLSV